VLLLVLLLPLHAASLQIILPTPCNPVPQEITGSLRVRVLFMMVLLAGFCCRCSFLLIALAKHVVQGYDIGDAS
jgi:hypothetical protein